MLVWSPDDTPEDAGRVILNAIFGVRDASEIPMEANALFPVFNEDTGRYNDMGTGPGGVSSNLHESHEFCSDS